MDRFAKAYITISVAQRASQGWFFSTYVLFLREHGLGLLQANLLNTGYMAVSFLLDPPTGYLGDRIGQRKVYVFGQIFWALGMLIYGLGNGFGDFLLAEMTGAVGSALISGALESWLRNNTGEEETHKAISKAESWANLAVIPSAIMGGLVGEQIGMEWPWLLAAASSTLSAILASILLSRLPEGTKRNDNGDFLPFWEIVGQTLRNKPIRFALLVTLVSMACFQPLNMFWAPIFKDMSGTSGWLGMLWIPMSSAIALGSYLVQNKKEYASPLGIALTLLVIGCPIAIAASHPLFPITLTFFLAHETGRGALRPLVFTYVNRYIKDEVRTTVNSLKGAAGTLGGMIGLLISGFLTLYLSPLNIWGISALALIGLALYAWRKKN